MKTKNLAKNTIPSQNNLISKFTEYKIVLKRNSSLKTTTILKYTAYHGKTKVFIIKLYVFCACDNVQLKCSLRCDYAIIFKLFKYTDAIKYKRFMYSHIYVFLVLSNHKIMVSTYIRSLTEI